MTRPASTKTCRGASTRKRAPARTAHIEYQPAGLDATCRRVREAYHADRRPGRPGRVHHPRARHRPVRQPGPWADIPDGLFPPLVTCRACQHITAKEHITVTGGMP